MPFAQPGDISAVLNSFAMRGQSEAERRNRDLQAAAERRAGMAALGGVLGSVAGSYFGPAGGAVGGALGARLMGGRQTGLAPVATAAGQGFQMGQAQSAFEQAQADKAAQGRVLEAATPRMPESVKAQSAYDDMSALLGREYGGGDTSAVLGQRPEVSPEDSALAERNKMLSGILAGAKGAAQPLQAAAQGATLLGASTPQPKDRFRPLSPKELAFYPGATAGQVNERTGKVDSLHFPTEKAQNEFNNLRVELLTKYRANPKSLTTQEQNILQYMAVANPLNQLVGGTVNPLPGLTGPQKEAAQPKPAEADALNGARQALKEGKDRKAVEKRLKEWGYDPRKL